MRAWLLVLAVACGVAGAQTERISRPGEYRGFAPALYTETVRTSSYLRLRDGTRLAMDLYRPAANGKPVETPYPVLWEHSLSRRSPPDVVQGSVTRRMHELTKYGYVVAYVERRGLGASFGARRGYNDRTEARDAYDVTEWLAAQPWSTGKVGVFGCSNTGDAAMHAASFMPPHLKAVFAGCFSWNKFDGFMRGAILANWGVGPERPVEEDLKNPPVDGDESRTLLAQAVEQHRGSTPLSTMWRGMPFRDSWTDITASRFWIEGSVSTYRDQLARGGAAFFIFGGWNDDFRREGLIAWNYLRNNPARIVIGPWLHCLNPGYELLADAHRFFDKYLKAIDNGIDREPPIQLYRQDGAGGGAWQTYTQWPPATAPSLQKLHIEVGVDAAGEHDLAPPTRAKPAAGSIALPVRPPVPCAEAGSRTQPCSQAGNGLRFTSAPMQRDTEVTGHPLATLWVSSPLPDQHVFVYLEDLAPNGDVRVVSDGRLKASLRALHRPPYHTLGLPWPRALESDHAPLAAGERVQLKLDLFPISYVFKTGHRMRVVVTANDSRERIAAPTGHALTLESSAERPSFIELPAVQAAVPNR